MNDVGEDTSDGRGEPSRLVWGLLERGDYVGAEALLRARLAKDPCNHWLLTRLGTALYEQRRYEEALRCHEDALALSARCPLVLWDLAGACQMLGRDADALRFYARLIRRGAARIATDECGEGLALARGLVADCHFRSADSYWAMGRPRAARNALERHLRLRGPGCRSIYALKEVRAHQREWA